MIRLTALQMRDGDHHEHLHRVRWVDPLTGESGWVAGSDLALWLDHSPMNVAVVGDYPATYAFVGTTATASTAVHLRAFDSDGWTDDLLTLPRVAPVRSAG